MTRLATLAAALMLTTATIAQEAPKDAAAKALASVQGAWAVATINGQSLADGGMDMSLTFTGDKYAQAMNGVVNERGTIKIDPGKKPMTMDLNIQEGDDAGKLQLAVFAVDAGTMTLHLNQPGATDRPADLAAREGYFLVVLKKAK